VPGLLIGMQELEPGFALDILPPPPLAASDNRG
jgi:hypothetical protein